MDVMYSRNRYNREDNKNYYRYNLPPRYDGNAFPLHRPDIVSTGTEISKTASPKPMTQEERNDSFVQMRARSPYRQSNFAQQYDTVEKREDVYEGAYEEETEIDISEEISDEPDLEEVVAAKPIIHRESSEKAESMEHKRGFSDVLHGLFEKFSQEDLLLLGLILIIAGDGGECSDKGLLVLALVLLFGIRD